MTFNIIRGSKQIGGSCVEITSNNTQIFIDAGLPIDYKSESEDKPIIDAINKKPADGILISHAHQDHYGLLNEVDRNIPLYMSEGTKRLIDTAAYFNGEEYLTQKLTIIKPGEPFMIGDIEITPYQVDHSGFDAMAFLIESDGKRVFYSGDFRGHGRKNMLFTEMLRNPPKDIDYLILEGTCIEKENSDNKSEKDIEADLKEAFKNNKMTFISYSSHNIDRIVSIYKACIASKKIIVIDPYTAYILDKIKDLGMIPQTNWSEYFRIYFARDSNTRKMDDSGDLFKFQYSKITGDEILKNRQSIVIRNSYNIRKKFDSHILPGETQLIYSQWGGYFEQEKDFWDTHNIKPDFIHSSGHAYQNEIIDFVNAISPKKIIPIHTMTPDKYLELFGNKITMLHDGEKLTV